MESEGQRDEVWKMPSSLQAPNITVFVIIKIIIIVIITISIINRFHRYTCLLYNPDLRSVLESYLYVTLEKFLNSLCLIFPA